MGDRIRIGELLAAIGTIGLAVVLGALDWFTAEVTIPPGDGRLAAFDRVGVDAGSLGWFAFAFLIIALLASVVFFLRALTGRGPERAMLQAPIAYALAAWTFLVVLVRTFVFPPGLSPDAVSGEQLLSRAEFDAATVDLDLATGGWLGLLFLLLIVVGLWVAMSDERTGSAAAKAHTAALMADVPVRPVPAAAAAPSPDASVVADDAIPTDPASPPNPAGDSA